MFRSIPGLGKIVLQGRLLRFRRAAPASHLRRADDRISGSSCPSARARSPSGLESAGRLRAARQRHRSTEARSRPPPDRLNRRAAPRTPQRRSLGQPLRQHPVASSRRVQATAPWPLRAGRDDALAGRQDAGPDPGPVTSGDDWQAEIRNPFRVARGSWHRLLFTPISPRAGRTRIDRDQRSPFIASSGWSPIATETAREPEASSWPGPGSVRLRALRPSGQGPGLIRSVRSVIAGHSRCDIRSGRRGLCPGPMFGMSRLGPVGKQSVADGPAPARSRVTLPRGPARRSLRQRRRDRPSWYAPVRADTGRERRPDRLSQVYSGVESPIKPVSARLIGRSCPRSVVTSCTRDGGLIHKNVRRI